MNRPQWLDWTQRLQAIAQAGLAYTHDHFDAERFRELRKIAAEIMAAHTQADLDEVQMIFNAESGYATPKVDVRGVVFKEGKLLMVKELLDGGAWTLPGGWADINEMPSTAVEREVREEAGVIVKATKLLAVFDRNLHGHPVPLVHSYKLFFLCELIAEATPDPIETAEPTYFFENNLPELSLSRVTTEEIHLMFSHLNDLQRPTDFD